MRIRGGGSWRTHHHNGLQPVGSLNHDGLFSSTPTPPPQTPPGPVPHQWPKTPPKTHRHQQDSQSSAPLCRDCSKVSSPHHCLSLKHSKARVSPSNIINPDYPAPVPVSRINSSSLCSKHVCFRETVSLKNPAGKITWSGEADGNTDIKSLSSDSWRSGFTSSSAETLSTASSVSSLYSDHGRWCEEEKAFPLKKRRLSLEKFTMKLERKTRSGPVRMTKGGKKKRIRSSSSSADESKEETNSSTTAAAAAKRDDSDIGRRAVMKEESLRCTRTSGRGWRCRKLKIEGHSSWCEHHLRMRREYMYSRRAGSRSSASSVIGEPDHHYASKKGCVDFKEGCSCYSDHHEEGAGKHHLFAAGKKRKKVMISSILDRTTPLLALPAETARACH